MLESSTPTSRVRLLLALGFAPVLGLLPALFLSACGDARALEWRGSRGPSRYSLSERAETEHGIAPRYALRILEPGPTLGGSSWCFRPDPRIQYYIRILPEHPEGPERDEESESPTGPF